MGEPVSMKTVTLVRSTPPAHGLAALLNLGTPHGGKAVVHATSGDGSEGVSLRFSAAELHFSLHKVEGHIRS